MKRFAIELTITVIAALLFSGVYALAEATPLVGEETHTEAMKASQTREFQPRTVELEREKIPLAAEPEDPEPEPQPEPQPKYSVTPEERELMAQIVYLEAGAECADGQQGVAEVILNRRDNAGFPDDIREVVFAEGQFTSAGYLELAKPVKEHYEAVDRALAGDAPVLEPDVVFFSQQGENDRVYAKIGNHFFCREYIW